MTDIVLFSVSAALLIGWGIAHLLPTKRVVAGFGNISADNKRIITMEWIIEGTTLIFIGTLVALLTILDRTSSASVAIYLASCIMLNVLSLISFFTGFKIHFLPFKLCPVIFTGTSLLILWGLYL